MRAEILDEVYGVVLDRIRNPRPDSYTSGLVSKGLKAVARKVGEEALEVVMASLVEDDESIIMEAADLLYHLLVLLAVRGIPVEEVWKELERRRR